VSDDNLLEFLSERVLATRQMHHMKYPVQMDEPAAGVIIDCPEDALTCVVMPTFVRNVLHMEMHFFVDGERVDPQFHDPDTPNGCIELTLQRPNATAKL
jgi:hypothetical protein